MNEPDINKLKATIKQKYYLYRNGIVSDSLKKAGYPYKIIYGLQLPQIREISASVGKNKNLALSLWNDDSIRENRLLAPFIFPPDEISEEDIFHLIEGLETKEEAEILNFGLLRFLPDAKKINDMNFSKSVNPEVSSYCKHLLQRYIS